MPDENKNPVWTAQTSTNQSLDDFVLDFGETENNEKIENSEQESHNLWGIEQEAGEEMVSTDIDLNDINLFGEEENKSGDDQQNDIKIEDEKEDNWIVNDDFNISLDDNLNQENNEGTSTEQELLLDTNEILENENDGIINNDENERIENNMDVEEPEAEDAEEPEVEDVEEPEAEDVEEPEAEDVEEPEVEDAEEPETEDVEEPEAEDAEEPEAEDVEEPEAEDVEEPEAEDVEEPEAEDVEEPEVEDAEEPEAEDVEEPEAEDVEEPEVEDAEEPEAEDVEEPEAEDVEEPEVEDAEEPEVEDVEEPEAEDVEEPEVEDAEEPEVEDVEEPEAEDVEEPEVEDAEEPETEDVEEPEAEDAEEPKVEDNFDQPINQPEIGDLLWDSSMDFPEGTNDNIETDVMNNETQNFTLDYQEEELDKSKDVEVGDIEWNKDAQTQVKSEVIPEKQINETTSANLVNEVVAASIPSESSDIKVQNSPQESSNSLQESTDWIPWQQIKSTLSLDQILDSELTDNPQFADNSKTVPTNVSIAWGAFGNKKMIWIIAGLWLFILAGIVVVLAFPSKNENKGGNSEIYQTIEEYGVDQWHQAPTQSEYETTWQDFSNPHPGNSTVEQDFPEVETEGEWDLWTEESTDPREPEPYTCEWNECWEDQEITNNGDNKLNIESIEEKISTFKTNAEGIYSYWDENQDKKLVRYAAQVISLCESYQEQIENGEWLDEESFLSFETNVNSIFTKINEYLGWESDIQTFIKSNFDEEYDFPWKEEHREYINNRANWLQ